MTQLKAYLGIISLLLAGCAASPQFDSTNVNKALTPAQAVTTINAVRGSRVLWGGIIVSATNLAGKTRFEILSYPLTLSQRPDVGAAPQGRFLAIKDGYVETLDYAPGKPVTLKGALTETRDGLIGESAYVYPVIEVESLYLWTQSSAVTKPRVNFGLGIILNN